MDQGELRWRVSQSSAQNEPCRRRAGDGRRSWGMCAVEYKNRRAVQASSRGVVSLCMAVRARWHPWQPLQMLLPIPWAPRTRFEAALGNGALAEESMFARIFPASLFVFDPVRCTHSPVTGEHESRLLDFSHLDCACVRPMSRSSVRGPMCNQSLLFTCACPTCRCPWSFRHCHNQQCINVGQSLDSLTPPIAVPQTISDDTTQSAE